MAAPSLVTASNGLAFTTASGNMGTWPAVAVVAGDLVIYQSLQDGTGADFTVSSTSSNIENLAGTNGAVDLIGSFDAGNPVAAQMHLWVGRVIANEANPNNCGILVASSSGDDGYNRAYIFRDVNLGTTINDILENGSSGASPSERGTSTTVPDVDVTTLGADRLAVDFVGVDDDNAVSSFTGQSGGTWIESIGEFLSSTGTDGCIQNQVASMASAGTIGGGTLTMAASDSWVSVGFALIPVGSAATPSLVYQPARPSLYSR